MKKIKNIWQKLGKWVPTHKVRFFLICGVLAVIVVLALDYLFLAPENGKDVLVEAHGMLFDIILFGIILTVYEAVTEKERLIKSYKDQLKSFEGWHGEEAAFRVRYVVCELEKLGVNDLKLDNLHLGKLKKEIVEEQVKRGVMITINLNRAELQKADFQRCNLIRADLFRANLEQANFEGAGLLGASLSEANMIRANLSNANLEGANLHKAKLGRAVLSEANLKGVSLHDASLVKATLEGATFEGAYLVGANFREADLRGANISGADLRGAELKGAEAFDYQMKDFKEVMTEEQIISMNWFDEKGNFIDKEKSLKSKKQETSVRNQEILIGPKGGKYYLSSKGKKVYLKRKPKQ